MCRARRRRRSRTSPAPNNVLDFERLLHRPVLAAFGEVGQGAKVPTYTPFSGAPGYSLDGVFDEAFETVDPLSGLPAATLEVVFGASLSSFRSPPVMNDQLFIPRTGTTYLVREVRPDGHGWVQLGLNAT